MRSKTLLLLTLFPPVLVSCAQKELPPACYEKPASGQCKAAHERFYYDTGARRCKPFIWGGCDGNVPFETLKECTNSCDATGPDESSGMKKAVPARDTEE